VKNKVVVIGFLAAAIAAMGAAGCASEKQEQARLRALARVARQQAEQAALAQAPGGTIKEGELEDDNGKLIWWFDLVTPGSKAVTEVSVDAITGGVISVATETSEPQTENK
jgi:uncharacterized membrane protein YkoI